MITNEVEEIRKALFTPCETKEHLGTWIRVFLGLHFPDATVSDESNSNPLDLIWEVYDKCRRNDDEDYSRVMAYAGRGGFKTLGASVLEVMQILHLGRNVAHMAAIFDQSKKSQEYVRNFFAMPYIRDFRVGQNVKKIEICYFVHRETGNILTEREWAEAPDQNAYFRKYNYIQIVLCTMTGANSAHTEFLCIDGDSKVLLKQEGGDRDRRASTVRGIYKRLAGFPAGGRPSEEDALPNVVGIPAVYLEALSVNPTTWKFEFKQIVGATRRRADRLKLRTAAGKELVCTHDHPIAVFGKGFKQASELKNGDRLLTIGRAKGKSSKDLTEFQTPSKDGVASLVTESDTWEQVVLGSLLGDAGIYKKTENNPYIKEQHCLDQADYIQWKRELLSTKLRTVDIKAVSGFTGEPMIGYRSGCSPLLLPYKDIRTDFSGIEALGPQGLAIWYQDDGCAGNGFRLSTEGWNESQNRFLADFLMRKFQIEVEVGSYSRESKTYWYLHGGVAAKRRLADICSPFIHPSMAYKFDLEGNKGECQFCGETYWYYERGRTAKDCGRPECRAVTTKTLHIDLLESVEVLPPDWVYDLTLEGNHNIFANSILVHQCVDEVDVVPKQHRPAYEEAKHIPDPRDGMMPVTLLTSTRKFSYGLVQEEIENSFNSHLKVRHWNVIDITKACEPARHKPELPKRTYWIDDSNLKHIIDEDYRLLDSQTQKKYVQKEGFAGCKDCPLFAACKGRLATHQTSSSPMLKPISSIIAQFRNASLSAVLTQLLCRKPDESGLIYPKFDREVHMKSARQIAEMITGEKIDREISKTELLQLFVSKGGKFYAGMDFGFTHPFAVVFGVVFGQFVFITTVISMAGLELDEKIAISAPINGFEPTVFGDPEAPADIATFKRKGFRMKEWDKYKGSVKAGIEIVRMKMAPAVGDPTFFMLAGDDGCELLASRLSKYHFLTDAAGQISDEPDDENDDEADAMRYLVMNVFAPKGKLVLPPTGSQIADIKKMVESPSTNVAGQQSDWMRNHILSLVEDGSAGSTIEGGTPGGTIKKGKFIFDS